MSVSLPHFLIGRNSTGKLIIIMLVSKEILH